jgi:hypothetical protein
VDLHQDLLEDLEVGAFEVEVLHRTCVVQTEAAGEIVDR